MTRLTLFLAFLLVPACKKPVPPVAEPPIVVAPPAVVEALPAPPPAPAPEVGELRWVYFDFDRYALRPDQREALLHDASLLKANPESEIRIEGHCDERGTTDYNLALGDLRANAARNFLVAQGISAGRITTVSYGEERPADPGHDEAAWARNRRAEVKLASSNPLYVRR